MSSSAIFQRLLLDLWAGIRGVPASLSQGATPPLPLVQFKLSLGGAQPPLSLSPKAQ